MFFLPVPFDLQGVAVHPEAITVTVEQFYRDHAIESPEVKPKDFVKLLIEAC